MNSIFVRAVKMPITLRAFTLPDADGNFNIYINEALSDEAKKKSLEHEKRHIKRIDFSYSGSAGLVEAIIESDK